MFEVLHSQLQVHVFALTLFTCTIATNVKVPCTIAWHSIHINHKPFPPQNILV